MHGSGPPLDPYPRDDEVREAPLSDKPPSPARSKASRSNSPGSFELDDFLEKDEAYRAIMSETMGDGLAQNFLFDDSPPRQTESPPRQPQPSPQQRTFNGKQPPSQKPPPPDYVDDARPPRTAAEATRRAASLAARYHGVVADDLLPEGEAPEVYAAAIAGEPPTGTSITAPSAKNSLIMNDTAAADVSVTGRPESANARKSNQR